MTTIAVLVKVKEGVSPEDYERWVLESYASAVRELPSVSAWRNHKVGGVLGSDEAPPYDYVVTLQVEDLAQLGEEMAEDRTRALLSELHGYTEVTQLVAERFV